MPSVEVERLLNEIGQVLAEDKEFPLDGTLLYAKVDTGYVAPSIFKDLGSRILFRFPSDGLTYPLLDLWEAELPDKRWTAIEYVIRDGVNSMLTSRIPKRSIPRKMRVTSGTA